MPNSRQRRVIDPILTTHVQGYQHPEHIGMHLFPAVPVNVTGGKVIEFNRNSFRLYNTARAPGAATKRMNTGYEGKDFALENHALDALVPREHLREAEEVPGIDLASAATDDVSSAMSLYLEYQQAQKARNTANYAASNRTALSGTSRWNDKVNSDPIGDVEAARSAVRAKVGMYPNVMMLSADAFDALKQHPDIVDRIKHTQTGVVTEDLLATIFSIDKVVVGKAVAVGTDDLQFDVWGKDVVLAYVPSVITTIRQPSYGYTYTMRGHPFVEAPYWDQSHKSWIYGMSYERAAVLTGIESGYLIQTAVD